MQRSLLPPPLFFARDTVFEQGVFPNDASLSSPSTAPLCLCVIQLSNKCFLTTHPSLLSPPLFFACVFVSYRVMPRTACQQEEYPEPEGHPSSQDRPAGGAHPLHAHQRLLQPLPRDAQVRFSFVPLGLFMFFSLATLCTSFHVLS